MDSLLYATEQHRFIHEQKRRGCDPKKCNDWYHIHNNQATQALMRSFLQWCTQLAFSTSPPAEWSQMYLRALAAIPGTDIKERTLHTPSEGPLGSGEWKAVADALNDSGTSTPVAGADGSGGLLQAAGSEPATGSGDRLSIARTGQDQYPFTDPAGWSMKQRMWVAEVARDQCRHKYTNQPMVQRWRYRSQYNKTRDGKSKNAKVTSNYPVATSSWLRLLRLMRHFFKERNLLDHFGPPSWIEGVLSYPFPEAWWACRLSLERDRVPRNVAHVLVDHLLYRRFDCLVI